MATTTVRLPDELAQQWRDYCAARGIGTSTALRRVIEGVLSRSPELRKSTAPDTGHRMARVCTHLTESERESIRARARYHGMPRARWIANVIRAALTREPQFCADELEALDRSTFQLSAIGRNLNQIARRLNEGQQQQSVESQQIELLRQDVEQHIGELNRLVQACADRWVIE